MQSRRKPVAKDAKGSEATARARLAASYEQFIREGDPARKSTAGEDLIRAIFGRAAIAEDPLR